MPDDPYSLGDLAHLADVTPRTVRYYLAQGLLPSPEAAGPATRYSEGHLARLRLVKRLQRDHLPLAEIRLRLERLGDDEVIASVSALDARTPEPSQEPGETLSFVRSLMQQSGIRPSTSYPERDGGVRLARMRLAESMDEAFAGAPSSVAPLVPAHAALARALPPWRDALQVCAFGHCVEQGAHGTGPVIVLGTEHHAVTDAPHDDLGGVEAATLGQAHRLASAGHEDLGHLHGVLGLVGAVVHGRFR